MSDSERIDRLESELADLRSKLHSILDAHSKALAILAGYAECKQLFDRSPNREVESRVGVRVCKSCVGSGWLARDELCHECEAKGFTKLGPLDRLAGLV